MESTIVIKVKHGKTLRRFNARVDAAGKLELHFAGLREKVLNLFNLSPDVNLTLTYLDEDGDVVTLADDDDLHDVMRQSLNPLRITAKVNSDMASSSSVRSSGNSTPMRSAPSVPHPLPNLNNAVSEILKVVPEPIGEALSKLSVDLASKAVSSSPQLPELVQHFSKMLQTIIPDSQFASSQPVGSESAMPTSKAKEPEASGGNGARSKAVPVSKPEKVPGESVDKVDHSGTTKGKSTSVTPASSSLDNADQRSHNNDEVKKFGQGSLDAETSKPAWMNIKAVASSVLGTNNDKEVKKPDEAWKPFGPFYNQLNAPNNVNLGGSTSSELNQNLAGQCPFTGVPLANEPAVPYSHFGPRVPPFKRSYSQGGMSGIFHRGVRCDGCGVHPIVGPRFKSKVKDDYDLCSLCFTEMGKESDYVRLERPIPFRHPQPLKGLYDFNARGNPPILPHVLKGLVKPNRAKLDSRFIMDVNVIDGTMMAPLTPFTKIWRMRNNGTLMWPQGTQLVWIGGDRLRATLSARLQIPGDGLAIEDELEVAVDFIAPALPGRYISYWRMASPSGQKFGQRVWVLIQVDASLKESVCDNFQGLNLNLPPVGSGINGAENMTTTNVESMAVDGQFPKPETSDRRTEFVEPLVEQLPANKQDLDFPINDNLLVSGVPVPTPLATVSYPTVDSSAIPPPVSSLIWPPMMSSPAPPPVIYSPPPPPVVSSPPLSPAADAESSVRANSAKDDVEQTLLKELEEMGFRQVDLNKEILRMNEYNLEQSVDDLCGVSEWDPILEELQEMGFCDNEVNKKLLKKNNGSIKGVVMDLLTGEKA